MCAREGATASATYQSTHWPCSAGHGGNGSADTTAPAPALPPVSFTHAVPASTIPPASTSASSRSSFSLSRVPRRTQLQHTATHTHTHTETHTATHTQAVRHTHPDAQTHTPSSCVCPLPLPPSLSLYVCVCVCVCVSFLSFSFTSQREVQVQPSLTSCEVSLLMRTADETRRDERKREETSVFCSGRHIQCVVYLLLRVLSCRHLSLLSRTTR